MTRSFTSHLDETEPSGWVYGKSRAELDALYALAQAAGDDEAADYYEERIAMYDMMRERGEDV